MTIDRIEALRHWHAKSGEPCADGLDLVEEDGRWVMRYRGMLWSVLCWCCFDWLAPEHYDLFDPSLPCAECQTEAARADHEPDPT